MNIRSLAGSIIFIISAFSFGCKSPTAVGTGGAPVLTIVPENFRGVQFTNYAFKAKITNHDPDYTYLTWNLGIVDSLYFKTLVNQPVNITYQKPGTYIIAVKAYDYYTDSVIATAREQIIIDTAQSSVEIIPQFYNGILPMTTKGTTDPFTISVKTTLPEQELYQFWDFGDGTTDSFKSRNITHSFPHPGSYVLKVDIYQKNGIYVGTDTALINIGRPSFTLDEIKHFGKIEEYIFLDGTYPVDARRFPLSFGAPLSGTNITSGWSANSFSLHSSNGTDNLNITVTLSDDGTKVESMIFHVNEHELEINGNTVYGSFDYEVFNMTLFFVSSDQIGFRISGSDLKKNITNLSYSGEIAVVSGAGSFDPWTNFNQLNPDNTIPPQSILVFSRK